MRHILTEIVDLLGDVIGIRGRTDAKSGPDSDRSTQVTNQALCLSSLVNGRRDHDNQRASWNVAHRNRQCNVDSGDDICGNTLLSGWCLSDDIRTAQQEWKSALLDLIWRPETK